MLLIHFSHFTAIQRYLVWVDNKGSLFDIHLGIYETNGPWDLNKFKQQNYYLFIYLHFYKLFIS